MESCQQTVPEAITAFLEGEDFEQLIAERDSLIQEIKELEKIAFKKGEDRTDPAWQFRPGPDVRYQMNLEYLAELCSFIEEKYNREIVWEELEEDEQQ